MSEQTNAIMTTELQDAYDKNILLTDENGVEEEHEIVAEYTFQGNHYAVLQSNQEGQQEELLFFRVTKTDTKEFEIHSIDDDDEWENISEIYDEIMFSKNETLDEG